VNDELERMLKEMAVSHVGGMEQNLRRVEGSTFTFSLWRL